MNVNSSSADSWKFLKFSILKFWIEIWVSGSTAAIFKPLMVPLSAFHSNQQNELIAS